MAIALLSHEVSDLTLGKPLLVWLPASASVRAALVALKQNEEVCEISVWDCAPESHAIAQQTKEDFDNQQARKACRCVGKICMQRIICYLASEESLRDVAAALNAPVTILLEKQRPLVQHVDPEASLHAALATICDGGAQNLVVEITDSLAKHGHAMRANMFLNKNRMMQVLSLKAHNGHNYCWLTHEDVLRFLLGFISVFSPLPIMGIKDLGLIQTDVLMVGIDDEASSALKAINSACLNQTAVAVVDKSEGEDGNFQIVGEISCSTFQLCNETAAVALAALSVGDFLSYIQDWRSTPETLMEAMSEKLSRMSSLTSKNREKDEQYVGQLLHDLEMSSDEEFGADSPTGPHDLLHTHHLRHFHSFGRSGFAKSHSEPICCRPTSSLIAVLMQALAHRQHYVWVTDEDNTLVGMVTFEGILGVLSEHLSLLC